MDIMYRGGFNPYDYQAMERTREDYEDYMDEMEDIMDEIYSEMYDEVA